MKMTTCHAVLTKHQYHSFAPVNMDELQKEGGKILNEINVRSEGGLFTKKKMENDFRNEMRKIREES